MAAHKTNIPDAGGSGSQDVEDVLRVIASLQHRRQESNPVVTGILSTLRQKFDDGPRTIEHLRELVDALIRPSLAAPALYLLKRQDALARQSLEAIRIIAVVAHVAGCSGYGDVITDMIDGDPTLRRPSSDPLP